MLGESLAAVGQYDGPVFRLFVVRMVYDHFLDRIVFVPPDFAVLGHVIFRFRFTSPPAVYSIQLFDAAPPIYYLIPKMLDLYASSMVNAKSRG